MYAEYILKHQKQKKQNQLKSATKTDRTQKGYKRVDVGGQSQGNKGRSRREGKLAKDVESVSVAGNMRFQMRAESWQGPPLAYQGRHRHRQLLPRGVISSPDFVMA